MVLTIFPGLKPLLLSKRPMFGDNLSLVFNRKSFYRFVKVALKLCIINGRSGIDSGFKFKHHRILLKYGDAPSGQVRYFGMMAHVE